MATKILHLSSTVAFTDIENTIVQSMELLKSDFTFAYASPNGSISKALRKKEINYLPLENMDYDSVANVVKTFEPDIIHAHGIDACLIANKFSKDIKVIAHIHEDAEFMQKLSKISFKFNLASKNFTTIIWPSEKALQHYKYNKSILEKSIFLEKAINPEDVIAKASSSNENIKNNFDILVFSDNLSIDVLMKLVNVLALLKNRGFSFKCGILSSNSQSDKLLPYIKENNLEDSFLFLNETIEYYNILSKSKVLFIMENHEDTPIMALEALALGIPVLATPSTGIQNIIQNEFNGFIADNEFDLSNFAARMLDDRHLWLLLSTNALTNADNQNNLEKYIADLKELYTK